MSTFLHVLGIILIIVGALMVTIFIYVILPGKVEKWKVARKPKKLDEKGE